MFTASEKESSIFHQEKRFQTEIILLEKIIETTIFQNPLILSSINVINFLYNVHDIEVIKTITKIHVLPVTEEHPQSEVQLQGPHEQPLPSNKLVNMMNKKI